MSRAAPPETFSPRPCAPGALDAIGRRLHLRLPLVVRGDGAAGGALACLPGRRAGAARGGRARVHAGAEQLEQNKDYFMYSLE